MSRYETLEVSLQTDNRNSSHLSQTVDYEDKDTGDADERFADDNSEFCVSVNCTIATKSCAKS